MVHMVHNGDNVELEIILWLLKGDSHLREISRGIGVSHSTVLRKINFLTAEGVLDYKLIGKNKIFSIKKTIQAKNYIYNAERYKLLKLLKKYPELEIISGKILNKTRKILVVFFGSYADFSAEADSDIDLYVSTQNKKLKQEIEEINSGLSVKTGEFELSSFLIREIVKKHVILEGVDEFYEKIGFF